MQKLHLYADENISGSMVSRVRSDGHDVFWARTDAPGLTDWRHLSAAVEEQRIFVTHDTDFGALVHLQCQVASCGIILLRLKNMLTLEERADRLVEVLRSHGPLLVNRLTTVSAKLLRITDLPAAG